MTGRDLTRQQTGADAGEILSLEEVERRHVLKILRACNGSRKDAARILAVDRKTLARKLSRWSISDD